MITLAEALKLQQEGTQALVDAILEMIEKAKKQERERILGFMHKSEIEAGYIMREDIWQAIKEEKC